MTNEAIILFQKNAELWARRAMDTRYKIITTESSCPGYVAERERVAWRVATFQAKFYADRAIKALTE